MSNMSDMSGGPMQDNLPFKFKRNWLGQQVLMMRHKTMGYAPGDWNYVWRKADQDDVVKLMSAFSNTKKDLQLLIRIKEENPELLI